MTGPGREEVVTVETEGWQDRCPDRFQLGEGARWHAGRLYFVDLLQGALYSLGGGPGPGPDGGGGPGPGPDGGGGPGPGPDGGGGPADPRPEARSDVPLGAVAPVHGRPGEWIAAAGPGIALLRPGALPHWLARPEEGAPRPMRMNDAACDPVGRFWATSMAADAEPGAGSLYRVDRDGSARRVLTGLTVPNGPVFDGAGSTLFLADSARGLIASHAVDPGSGRLGPARPFVRLEPGEGKPDGMTVDDAGYLWVALWGAGRVRRYDPRGRLCEEVAVPTPNVSSVAFGGGLMHVTTARHRLAEPDAWAGAVLARRSGVTAPPAAPFRPSFRLPLPSAASFPPAASFPRAVPDPPPPP
ncbi:SMP-30/gluconolactonase/LRE family protein [Kitasatospora purpeofusca]|uniref:SMP-30/gluconolactonase/LRE family protein n=1 Tax=Kitasatospora purpeofusca TaxID=67352 RepID=UPI003694B101